MKEIIRKLEGKLPMSSNNIRHEFEQIDSILNGMLELIEKLKIKEDSISFIQEQISECKLSIASIEKNQEEIKQSLVENNKRIGEVNSNLNKRFGQLYENMVGKEDLQLKELQKLHYSVKANANDTCKVVVKTIAKTIKRNSIEHLDYHLTDHCNLNCAGCSTFAPIANKRFAEVESFEQDMKRLYDLIGDSIQQIHLLGGEPLLHPHVEQFAKICRSIFSKARIDITTNGLLVSSMPDSFWDVLCENNIAIKYTQYPVDFDYSKMIKYVNEKGVYVFSAGGNEPIKYFRRIPLNAKGTFNEYESFVQCPYTDCIQLSGGKLYHCPASAFSTLLNQKLEESNFANEKFKLIDGDYLDLDTVKNREEVLDFLSNAVPFCRYCDLKNIDEHVEWRQSERNISEWVDV